MDSFRPDGHKSPSIPKRLRILWISSILLLSAPALPAVLKAAEIDYYGKNTPITPFDIRYEKVQADLSRPIRPGLESGTIGPRFGFHNQKWWIKQALAVASRFPCERHGPRINPFARHHWVQEETLGGQGGHC